MSITFTENPGGLSPSRGPQASRNAATTITTHRAAFTKFSVQVGNSRRHAWHADGVLVQPVSHDLPAALQEQRSGYVRAAVGSLLAAGKSTPVHDAWRAAACTTHGAATVPAH